MVAIAPFQPTDTFVEPSRAQTGLSTRLSVLDTVMVGSGSTIGAELQATVRLARRAEELGFTRYWMAEHHGVPGVASSAPVVTVGAIAAATERIRVGSGGVMLPNHLPLIVAEQFGTLASLYPGRIDLGVGRAGAEPRTAAVLHRGLARYGLDELDQQIEQLAGFLTGRVPGGPPDPGLFVSPRAETPPAMWVLGASTGSAQVAASLGLPFAFAHHFNRGSAADSLDHYRRSFRPSAFSREPYSIVTVNAICAPTDEEAERIGRSAALFFRRMMQGKPGLMPSPEEVAQHHWTAEDPAFLRRRHHGQAIGSPPTVRAALTRLRDATGANELMLTTQMYAFDDRVRTLEQVSEMFVPAVASAPAAAR